MASAAPNPAHCDVTDLRDKLLASERVGSVSVVECINATPTLTEMTTYDVVPTIAFI